eukprot:scaffold118349_cov63-Phaeocystis_antarctica.AAC.2
MERVFASVWLVRPSELCALRQRWVVRGLGRAFLYLSIYLSCIRVLKYGYGKIHAVSVCGRADCTQRRPPSRNSVGMQGNVSRVCRESVGMQITSFGSENDVSTQGAEKLAHVFEMRNVLNDRRCRASGRRIPSARCTVVTKTCM